MTVRLRTLLLVGGALIALLVFHYAVMRYAFGRALTTLEDERMVQQVEQARAELDREIETLDSVAADYAAWDTTYAYVVDHTPRFAEVDLADEALRHLHLDAAAVVDLEGRVVLFRSLLEGPALAQLRTELGGQLAPGSPLLAFADLSTSHRGVVDLPGGPVEVAVRAIVKSDGTGPRRGALLMARKLDAEEIARLGRTVHLAVRIDPLPVEIARPGPDPVDVRAVSGDTITGALPLRDVYGTAQWVLRVDAPRPLLKEGERLFLYFVITLVASVAIVAVVTLVLLDSIVLRRLSNISRSVARIAETDDLTLSVSPGGQDELSAVGATIDSMLAKIRENRERTELASLETARVKAEFFANMSHEIRTPLNGVMGTLRLLEDTPLTPDQHESVRVALSCADGLLRVLNDVLDLSKMEAGKLAIDAEPLAIRMLADDVCALFGPSAAGKPVELWWRVAPDVPALILGDSVRLRQVLVNLVGNAVKFTTRGHVLIDVSCKRSEAGDSVLRVNVADTGVGIAADGLSAIFESFTQADTTTTRRFGGTGLGLTITRRLLNLMGGDIAVTSELGNGSTFTFWLPLIHGPAAVIPRLHARVLLADEPGLRRIVYAARLTDMGAEVVEVDDAEAAARRLEQEQTPLPDRPDLAVASGADLPIVVAVEPSGEPDTLAALAQLATRGALRAIVARDRAHADGLRFPGTAVLIQPVSTDQWLRAIGAAGSAAPATARPAAARARFSGRVLLAEDNVVNRAVAVGLLRKQGCTVDTAVNGLEAVRLAAEQRYDLILMDCQMPELDGFAATAEIRRRQTAARVPPVPIVALTADTMAAARERCLAAGMDDFLSKPFALDDLQAVLERYLVAEPVSPATT